MEVNVGGSTRVHAPTPPIKPKNKQHIFPISPFYFIYLSDCVRTQYCFQPPCSGVASGRFIPDVIQPSLFLLHYHYKSAC